MNQENQRLKPVILFGFALLIFGFMYFMAWRTPPVLPPGENTPQDEPYTSGDRAIVARISGTGGEIHPPLGERIPLSADPAPTCSGAGLFLIASTSRALIRFANGSQINLAGAGFLEVQPEGFSTRTGKFSAEFQANGFRMQVKTPYAILGIRGTRIWLELTEGVGMIRVLEGRILVTPGQGAPFEAAEMSTITIHSDGTVSAPPPPTSPVTPSPAIPPVREATESLSPLGGFPHEPQGQDGQSPPPAPQLQDGFNE